MGSHRCETVAERETASENSAVVVMSWDLFLKNKIQHRAISIFMQYILIR